MSTKMIRTVVLILGTLVVCFLGWQLVFNDGGIVKTGYNAMANGINAQWEKVAGDGSTLVPLWDATGADTGGSGFDIDVN